MKSHTGYKTKQREMLLQYLKSMPDAHITAGDICRYFREKGETIGQSTIYRQLEGLVDEGILNKYMLGGNSSACFEYVAPDSHADAGVCFHCRCKKCGRLIHLHCDELVKVQMHLLKEHQFVMDPVRTVFYGFCKKCSEYIADHPEEQI